MKVAYCNSAKGFDATGQKRWERDLDAYADARRQGIQPETTQRAAVDQAVRFSDQAGMAYDAS